MNTLELKDLEIKDDFTIINGKKFEIIFTNAEKGRSFNRNTEEGVRELNSLKKEFNADNIIYIKQIHSDRILKYEGNGKDIINEEGDAIITNEKNVIIGVFTADCVPVILVDEEKKVTAAIHSGWRGTFESITLKTIDKMKNEFGSDVRNIKAYIGPHIRKCCYEVSEDLKQKFIEKKDTINEKELFNGNNLNLEACIIDDLRKSGINESNINSLDLCTYCSSDIKLHSYRKSQGSYGRMFSFIISR
ncbi:peptidoglycan editing factor PgeF [Clostridium beijerinckii]|uniref:peptidoglycan editing factor PgeF n=1 Tax=Clostridium beijerinckii TaxID=1520 RepID=UPI000809BD85|nr:peptidoglycan editing factor PgeF [Clostridium beijerinckii]OCB00944.1 laccase [Clostridium beijerinckii]